MRRKFNCPACLQMVVMDFGTDGKGVMPPHGRKDGWGGYECPAIGTTVDYVDPGEAKRKRQLDSAEAIRVRDEQWKAEREERERLRAEAREANPGLAVAETVGYSTRLALAAMMIGMPEHAKVVRDSRPGRLLSFGGGSYVERISDELA